MSDIRTNRSVSELIGDLASDVTGLFRKEFQLARAEAEEKAAEAVSHVGVLLFGAVVLIGAVGVLLAAIVEGVALILVAWGMQDTAASAVAALLVAVVAGIIGWIMVSRGLSGLKLRNLSMDRTAHSLSRDADTLKEKF